MFGFLGKGKNKAGHQNGQVAESTSQASSTMFSSQAAAALAAAAAAGNVFGNAGPAPAGRRLHGIDITVDLDTLRAGEKVAELQVCEQCRSARLTDTATVADGFDTCCTDQALPSNPVCCVFHQEPDLHTAAGFAGARQQTAKQGSSAHLRVLLSHLLLLPCTAHM